MTPCTDCTRPAVARGLCGTHYQSRRRAGSLEPLEGTRSLALRVPESTMEALEREAQRTGGSAYAVALRVLAAWGKKRKWTCPCHGKCRGYRQAGR